MEDKLLELIKKASYEEGGRQRLNCEEAFRIAAEVGVELLVIGGICNENNIRIGHCQLGCFK